MSVGTIGAVGWGCRAVGDKVARRAYELVSHEHPSPVWKRSNVTEVSDIIPLMEFEVGAAVGTLTIVIEWDRAKCRVTGGCYVGPSDPDATLTVTWTGLDGSEGKAECRLVRKAFA